MADVNDLRLEDSTVATLRRSSLRRRDDGPYKSAIIRTVMNAATITPVPIHSGQLFECRRRCSLFSKSTIRAPPCQIARGRTDYLSSSAKTSPMILVILWAGSGSPPSASATSSEKASTE